MPSKNKASGLSSQHIWWGHLQTLFQDMETHDYRDYTKRHSRETEIYSCHFLEEPPLGKFGLSLFCVRFRLIGLWPPLLWMVTCYTQNTVNLLCICFSGTFTEISEMMSDWILTNTNPIWQKANIIVTMYYRKLKIRSYSAVVLVILFNNYTI